MAPRAYRLGRRAESADDTRRRIVVATRALHVEQGVADTTVKQIARRADVSVGTVYHHFPSYDDVIRACGQLTFAIVRPPTNARFCRLPLDLRALKRFGPSCSPATSADLEAHAAIAGCRSSTRKWRIRPVWPRWCTRRWRRPVSAFSAWRRHRCHHPTRTNRDCRGEAADQIASTARPVGPARLIECPQTKRCDDGTRISEIADGIFRLSTFVEIAAGRVHLQPVPDRCRRRCFSIAARAMFPSFPLP